MIAWLVLLQTALTIAVAGPPTSPEYLPLHVALAEGLFTAQQVSVTLRSTRSDAAAAEMLASGQAQLAATSLDSALRLGGTEGVPPRLVWALTAAPPVALLVAPGRTDTIRSAADLVGQTVAIPAPGTAEDQALGLLLARAGVAVHHLKILSLGERGVVRALEGGEVAAGVLGEPYVSRLVKAARRESWWICGPPGTRRRCSAARPWGRRSSRKPAPSHRPPRSRPCGPRSRRRWPG